MPRRLRIEFEGVIYHVMARGNARQKIVRDDADRRRLIDGLEQAVVRHGWESLAYVQGPGRPRDYSLGLPQIRTCTLMHPVRHVMDHRCPSHDWVVSR